MAINEFVLEALKDSVSFIFGSTKTNEKYISDDEGFHCVRKEEYFLPFSKMAYKTVTIEHDNSGLPANTSTKRTYSSLGLTYTDTQNTEHKLENKIKKLMRF